MGAMPTIIIFSKNTPFRQYVRSLLPEGEQAVEVHDDTTCLEEIKKNPDAIVVLDVHSKKPAWCCESLEFLNSKSQDYFAANTRFVLLSWFADVDSMLDYAGKTKVTNLFLLDENAENLFYFRQLPFSGLTDLLDSLSNTTL